MKSLKCLCLSLVFIFIGSSWTHAQSAEPTMSAEKKEILKKEIQTFAQELNLSDAQKTKFRKVLQNYFGGLRSLREAGGSQWSKYKQYKSFRKDMYNDMKPLLSKEQFKVFKEWQKELEEKMKMMRNQKSN